MKHTDIIITSEIMNPVRKAVVIFQWRRTYARAESENIKATEFIQKPKLEKSCIEKTIFLSLIYFLQILIATMTNPIKHIPPIE